MATPCLAEGNGLDLTDADALGRWHRQQWRKAATLALATIAATPDPPAMDLVPRDHRAIAPCVE